MQKRHITAKLTSECGALAEANFHFHFSTFDGSCCVGKLDSQERRKRLSPNPTRKRARNVKTAQVGTREPLRVGERLSTSASRGRAAPDHVRVSRLRCGLSSSSPTRSVEDKPHWRSGKLGSIRGVGSLSLSFARQNKCFAGSFPGVSQKNAI